MKKFIENGLYFSRNGGTVHESRSSTPLMNISDEVNGFPSSNNTSVRLQSHRHGIHSLPSDRPLRDSSPVITKPEREVRLDELGNSSVE